MSAVHNEIQKLNPSAMIELFELDGSEVGADVRYFHAGTNEMSGDVVWQGITYSRMPIEATGFETRSSGALARPTLRVANLDGLMAAEAREQNYYLGSKLIRHRTFARFLDAVNFAGGNPEADPTQYMPLEVWYIDRKSEESAEALTFELAAALDMVGMQLPRRQIIQNTCTWAYRGETCNYTGGPVADLNNIATSDPTKDKCSKSLTGCKMRFGNAPLPFGGFPAVGLIR